LYLKYNGNIVLYLDGSTSIHSTDSRITLHYTTTISVFQSIFPEKIRVSISHQKEESLQIVDERFLTRWMPFLSLKVKVRTHDIAPIRQNAKVSQ